MSSSVQTIKFLWKHAFLEMGAEYVKKNNDKFVRDFANLYGLSVSFDGSVYSLRDPKYGRSVILRVKINNTETDSPESPLLASWNDDYAVPIKSMVMFLNMSEAIIQGEAQIPPL